MDDPNKTPPEPQSSAEPQPKSLPSKETIWFTLGVIPVLTLLAVLIHSDALSAATVAMSPFMAVISSVFLVKRNQARFPLVFGFLLALFLTVANLAISGLGCAVVSAATR